MEGLGQTPAACRVAFVLLGTSFRSNSLTSAVGAPVVSAGNSCGLGWAAGQPQCSRVKVRFWYWGACLCV